MKTVKRLKLYVKMLRELNEKFQLNRFLLTFQVGQNFLIARASATFLLNVLFLKPLPMIHHNWD